MSGEAYRPTDQQAAGIQRCIIAVGEHLEGSLTAADVGELGRLALPLVWEGWSPKYIVARMLLHCGQPELWEEICEEPV